jgi:glutamine amidotransferase
MSALTERGLTQPLKDKALEDRAPILGVCLGMQMLGWGSEEGRLAGLGLVDAYCRRFSFEKDSKQKVPHMGWSMLAPRRSGSRLLNGMEPKARFYFVHSYHLVCADRDDILASASYGIDFVAMVERGNVFGAQFHPEKSHRFGMALLHNFAEMKCSMLELFPVCCCATAGW